MFDFRPRTYSINGFKIQMQNIFEENTLSVKNYIEHSLSNDSYQQIYAERLMKNQQSIGELVGFFDFRKIIIIQSLTTFMQCIFTAMDVFKYKKNIPEFRNKWHEQADEVCKILDSMNKWSVREFLYKQIQSIELLINSFIKKDTSAQHHHYNCLLQNNRKFSFILTEGIIADNQKRFL